MTLIHSHCIHNHSLIRITIIIYNSMHVANTRRLPNHPFYHGLVRNKWFSMCITTQIFLHEPFFVEDASLQHLDRETFLFLHLLHAPNTTSTNIFWIRYYIINKTLNPITIIHPPQSLGLDISMNNHSSLLSNLYQIMMTTFIN